MVGARHEDGSITGHCFEPVLEDAVVERARSVRCRAEPTGPAQQRIVDFGDERLESITADNSKNAERAAAGSQNDRQRVVVFVQRRQTGNYLGALIGRRSSSMRTVPVTGRDGLDSLAGLEKACGEPSALVRAQTSARAPMAAVAFVLAVF